MYSKLLLPHIATPTCAKAKSRTINENIFSNNYNSSFPSGNLVATLSDYHAQFLLMVSQTRERDNENNQIYQDFTELNTHLESINLTNEILINRNNFDMSTGLLLKKMHQLINFWTPIQKSIQ